MMLPFGFSKSKKIQESSKNDFGNNRKMNINKKKYKEFIVKAVGFAARIGKQRGQFEEPEYSLEEISIASKSDSYIKMALMKHSYLIFKAGYDLKGNNDKAINYLKTRLRVMSFVTQKPTDILFQEIGDDLVKYSNAFLVKTRVKQLMPGVQAKGVFNDKPIGGYFRLDPVTIKIKRDEHGTIQKYLQETDDGQQKEFLPSEIIHFYLDKDASDAFGTPRIIAALEDVKLLRRIEGNIISLIYRFSIPIYQWIIGKPEKGFEATAAEIKEAQREVENMSLDGTIITNEKTEIKPIGVEGEALDASNYLQYFEKRVFAALGVSETQMGRGTSKQNADSMDEQAHDTVKHIQKTMAIFVENLMLNELLLEGGFNPILNEKDIVTFSFNEISLDTKIKLENHELLKYQSNFNTFDEARKTLGKKSDVDEQRLYINMIENKAAIDQIDAKTKGSLKLAKEQNKMNQDNNNSQSNDNSANKGIKGNGATKNTKPNKNIENKNRPENQHGKTSVNIKESVTIDESTKIIKSNQKKNFSLLYKKYKNICNDIVETRADIDIILRLGKDDLKNEITKIIKMYSFDGISKATNDINKLQLKYNLFPKDGINLLPFEEEAEETIEKLLKDIKSRIKERNNPQEIQIVFNSLQYRLKFLVNYIIPKVFWYSYIKTGKAFGLEKAYVNFNGSSDEKDHSSIIDINKFSLDDIPAFHAFCDCTVSFTKAGDK